MTPQANSAASQGGLHPERIGPYTIRSKLGSGGMATVYRAYYPPGKREVALKVLAIQFQDQPQIRARFEREAYMLQQFDHPHILPVYDFGEDGEMLYLVMRLLEGRSLEDVLANGHLPREEIGRYTREIASALDYAHARGIIHRDIKPANILLDQDQSVLLADFGVAHPTADDARLTAAGSFVGTAAYASPEQCRGDALDRRSDIYSLAVLTFQMATGRLPFEASSALAVIKLHLTERPPNPLAFNATLPVELYDVLVRGMAKDADDRYPSAMKFSEAVDAALGVHALPDMESSEDWLVGDISPVSFDPDAAPAAAAFPDPEDSAYQVITFADLPQAGTEGDPFAGVPSDEYDASELYFDDDAGLATPDDDISFVAAFGMPPEATADREPARATKRAPHAAIRPIQPPSAAQPRASRHGNGLYIAVLVSAVVLALVAAGVMLALRLDGESTPDAHTSYHDPTLDITFDYPQTWYLQLGLAALLSREATATVALSDAPVPVGGPYEGAALVITIQQIDPVAVFGVPAACKRVVPAGPGVAFDCMAGEGYATPQYDPFRTPYVQGVVLQGTLPPSAATLPLVLLPTGDMPWIAVAIAHWDGYPDARAALRDIAASVRRDP